MLFSTGAAPFSDGAIESDLTTAEVRNGVELYRLREIGFKPFRRVQTSQKEVELCRGDERIIGVASTKAVIIRGIMAPSPRAQATATNCRYFPN